VKDKAGKVIEDVKDRAGKVTKDVKDSYTLGKAKVEQAAHDGVKYAQDTVDKVKADL